MDFKKLVIALVTLAVFSHCENELESKISAIQPKPQFISNVTRGNILAPKPSQTITPTNFTFYFDGREFVNGTLLIFNAEVNASQLESGPGTNCVAGASSLAGHSWNGTSLLLGSSTATTQFYACNANDPVNFLSSTKVTSGSFGAGTYYIVLLGYDGTILLSHSSSLTKFSI